MGIIIWVLLEILCAFQQ